MDAGQLYKSGQLREAIDAQIAVVKAKPLDHGQRVFLFELLVFAGDLDRAQKQIAAVNYGQPELDSAVLEYRKLLDAERVRRQVFGGAGQPEFLKPPPEHVKKRLLGVVKLGSGALDEAEEAFEEANEQAPTLTGTLNDTPFDGLRDGDDCLGAVLEVFAHGQYFWVPLEQISVLTMNAPRYPRDLLWVPAHLELKEGESGEAFLPALYPGTELETDAQLKLGRLTDWRGEDLVRGVGAKVFFVGTEEMSLLDWRNLAVN